MRLVAEWVLWAIVRGGSLGLMVAGCAGTDQPSAAFRSVGRVSGSGPLLHLIDSVSLEENDTLYLGSPGTSFAVAEDGMIYVPDMSRDEVVRYSPDGGIDGIVGRKGSGPGELRGVGVAIDVKDSILLVRGYQNYRISTFRAKTGEYIGGVRYEGYLSSLSVDGTVAWYATMTPGSGKVFGSFDAVSPEEAADRPVLSGRLLDIPIEYRDLPGLDIMNNGHLVVRGDTMIAGFGALDYLVIATPSGTAIDTLVLPARQRRGAPSAVLAKVYRPRSGPPSVTFSAVSNFAGIWALRDGRILVYHRDLEVSGPERSAPVTGKAYISILSPDLRMACLDGELPYPEAAYPRIDVQNDTIYALDQMVQPAPATGTRTVVRKFVVDDGSCDWFPVRRPGP